MTVSKTRRAIAIAAVASLPIVFPASTSAQASDPTVTCSGDVAAVPFPDAGFNAPWYTRLRGDEFRQITVAVPLPAGTYEVSTTSYDGYTDRTSVTPQPIEQYVLQFLDAADNVVATSAPSADLADSIEEASWSGSLGQVVLAVDVVAVRAIHAHSGVGPNSVQPACFGVSQVVPPTTSTTTTTTSTTTTSTTTTSTTTSTTTTLPLTSTTIGDPISSTTTVPISSTTVAPPTSTSTPTTVVVAPPVQESPPADPITGTPTFTG